MAERKDLLKAHSFVTQRLVSALVDRDPDAPKSPLGRVTTATFVSVLIGIVALGGFLLLGKLRPGMATDWQDPSVVLQDMDSGGLFVYDDGQNGLYPMADITSARLLAGSGDSKATPPTVQVKSKLIKNVKRLQRQGVPSAPYELPAPADIAPYPMRICMSAQNVRQERFLTVQIGGTQPTSKDASLAVQTPDGTQYLVMRGTSHRLWARTGESSPLIGGLPVAQVSAAWLASLPVGAPVEPREIPGIGSSPTKGVKNLRVGDLARVGDEDSPDVRYYVQQVNGLARITYLDMRLAVEQRKAGDPVAISESDYAQVATQEEAGTPGLPYERPVGPQLQVSLQQTSVCATYTADDPEHPRIDIDLPTPALPVNAGSPRGNRADIVQMPNLTGALLVNNALKGTETSSFLVVNSKIYGIPDVASRRSLGYTSDNSTLMRVPGGVMALFENGLPAGVSLSANDIVPVP
ncbi:type VII secretion protein EccB [Aestuariimicrobium soli]|uniref:type VII secretion protein EccB n=1 Tax=Aestuariimicrobium soli TaxID=2035834 RepID=UPI003EBA6BBF